MLRNYSSNSDYLQDTLRLLTYTIYSDRYKQVRNANYTMSLATKKVFIFSSDKIN